MSPGNEDPDINVPTDDGVGQEAGGGGEGACLIVITCSRVAP